MCFDQVLTSRCISDSPRSTLNGAQTVIEGRAATERILKNADDRLVVVVGCVCPLTPHLHLR